VDAEEKSDVMIQSVYLGVTGAHIDSFKTPRHVAMPEDQERSRRLIATVCGRARGRSASHRRTCSSTRSAALLRGRAGGDPQSRGDDGHKLEADFHIIHGIGTRVKTRCGA